MERSLSGILRKDQSSEPADDQTPASGLPKRRSVKSKPGLPDLPNVCKICNRRLPSDQAHCWECGTPFVVRDLRPRGEPDVPAVRAYEELLDGRRAPQTEPAACPNDAPPRDHRMLLGGAAAIGLVLLGAALHWATTTASATVRIESVPGGAAVYSQNRLIGNTPLEISDGSCPRDLLLRLKGHEALHVKLEIPPCSSTIAWFTLRPGGEPALDTAESIQLAHSASGPDRVLVLRKSVSPSPNR
ncbi:MAG: PEGA domain-containing protein [Candidatus Riflebacteria bacterium]|nr:PEGA domain-containing protein [Candidatus Riflebacteria bacterium]